MLTAAPSATRRWWAWGIRGARQRSSRISREERLRLTSSGRRTWRPTRRRARCWTRSISSTPALRRHLTAASAVERLSSVASRSPRPLFCCLLSRCGAVAYRRRGLPASSQWGQAPGRPHETDPTPIDVMPDAHLRFKLTYKPGTTEVAPYQPWPEEPPLEDTPNTAPAPQAGRLPPQPKQGTRGKNSLGRKYLSSGENDDAVEPRAPKTPRDEKSSADQKSKRTGGGGPTHMDPTPPLSSRGASKTLPDGGQKGPAPSAVGRSR